jgi:hypothetical protein
MRVAPAVRELWRLAQERFGPDQDFTTIVRCVEEAAGVEVKPPD